MTPPSPPTAPAGPSTRARVDYRETSLRPSWDSLPAHLHEAVGAAVGSVVVEGAAPVTTGFTGAYAGRVRLADGREVFAKVGTPAQPHVVGALDPGGPTARGAAARHPGSGAGRRGRLRRVALPRPGGAGGAPARDAVDRAGRRRGARCLPGPRRGRHPGAGRPVSGSFGPLFAGDARVQATAAALADGLVRAGTGSVDRPARARGGGRPAHPAGARGAAGPLARAQRPATGQPARRPLRPRAPPRLELAVHRPRVGRPRRADAPHGAGRPGHQRPDVRLAADPRRRPRARRRVPRGGHRLHGGQPRRPAAAGVHARAAPSPAPAWPGRSWRCSPTAAAGRSDRDVRPPRAPGARVGKHPCRRARSPHPRARTPADHDAGVDPGPGAAAPQGVRGRPPQPADAERRDPHDPVAEVALDRAVVTGIDHSVSHLLDDWKVTNQKKSGRCWLFAGLNLLRVRTARTLGVKDFEFSQNHLLFWDKLEKANYLLEAIIDDRRPRRRRPHRRPPARRPRPATAASGTCSSPLVHKHGLVPKVAMPETDSSSHTGADERRPEHAAAPGRA